MLVLIADRKPSIHFVRERNGQLLQTGENTVDMRSGWCATGKTVQHVGKRTVWPASSLYVRSVRLIARLAAFRASRGVMCVSLFNSL